MRLVALLTAILSAFPASAAERFGARVVERDEILQAMQQSQGYEVTATTNGPRFQSEVIFRLVAANVSLASIDSTLRAGFVSESRERAHVAPFVERFRVKTPSLAERVRNLSGGNQQKVILAKWLATRPKILLLDEPTRGIDMNAKREIYAFIDELAGGGMGVIVVSSELPEILALADRILVMCEGRRTAEFTRAEATAERVLHAALPDLPAAAS